jgi:hypothetical protein
MENNKELFNYVFKYFTVIDKEVWIAGITTTFKTKRQIKKIFFENFEKKDHVLQGIWELNNFDLSDTSKSNIEKMKITNMISKFYIPMQNVNLTVKK